MQKRVSHHYFSFTRKERNGIMMLLCVILLLSAVPWIYPFVFKDEEFNRKILQDAAPLLTFNRTDSLENNGGGHYRDSFQYKSNYQPRQFSHEKWKGSLFYFDPNTLDEEGWKKLGLRDRTISIIRNFISKGGKFRQAEDIKKIWGLHEDEIERLLPYVNIEAVKEGKRSGPPNYPVPLPAKKSYQPVDINLADTADLAGLPGIGPKLSVRIVKFRESLGGFYDIQQVAETFGLPDSVFQRIKIFLLLKEKQVNRLNINTATLEELKQHPYIRYQVAGSLIRYREQHGPFSSVEELRKIMLINDQLYEKLSPYLTVK